MTAFPAGEWSVLLIGHQWPQDQELSALSAGARNRGQVRTEYSRLAELLRISRTGSLSDQRGFTIDDLRATVRRGEEHALSVAEKSCVKEAAYTLAYHAVSSLQHDLAAIAEEGNKEIQSIQNSPDAYEAKVSKITSVVTRFQALANLAAAKYGGTVVDAIQRILDAEGAEQSARQFCQQQGTVLEDMFRQPISEEDLDRQVEDTLRQQPTSPGSQSIYRNPPSAPRPPQDGAEPLGMLAETGHAPQVSAASSHVSAASVTDSLGATARVGINPHPGTSGPVGMPTALSPTPMPPSRLIPVSPASPPAAQLPTSQGACPVASLANASAGRFDGLPHTPTITPTELAQSFNKGMESGAPFSAAAHAAPPISVTSTEPQISHAAQTIPSAAPNPQVHVPVVDSPQPVHHVPAAETPPPTPIVAAAQPISPPVTPQAVGPLPTYGSDLRPPAATTITPTPPQSTPLPPSATPSSAPVTPSSVHSAANQPAVVRQTASSTPPPPPPTQGTQAVAATATGAAIGTASADATARKRLQRLVNTVARQQPRLAWAAGDRADKTTLLVTDLASGWIPPGIDLPSAVTLLRPARRRGNVEVLLGDVTVTANYTPTHHLADDGEQTPTSPRPRSVPDVSDLGWELSQATQWRDGLPRLAHTLAKAASAGTGVLDSEIDLLHEHLAETSNRVLDNYPDHIDTHDVGNWQLLAALDALVTGDKATANYHLAWFLAAKAG